MGEGGGGLAEPAGSADSATEGIERDDGRGRAASASDRRRLGVVMVGCVLGATVALGVVLTVVIWSDGSSDSGEGQSSASSLPPADDAEAEDALAYLDGEGSALLDVHESALSLVERPEAGTCHSLVATLNAEAPAPEVQEQVIGVADPVLQEALREEMRSLAAATANCDALADALVDGLERTSDVVTQRLSELEAQS